MVVISQRGPGEGQPCEITDGYHWKEIMVGDFEESYSIGSMNVISNLDP